MNVNYFLFCRNNPWKFVSDDRNITYQINMCDVMKETSSMHRCHSQTSICMMSNGKDPVSVGNLTSTGIADNFHDEEMTMVLAGDECPGHHANYTFLLTFKCGPDLVSVNN